MRQLQALRAKAEVLCAKVETLTHSCDQVGKEVRAKEAVIEQLAARLEEAENAAAEAEARAEAAEGAQVANKEACAARITQAESAVAQAELRTRSASDAKAKTDARLRNVCEQVAVLTKRSRADARRASLARAIAACAGFVVGAWFRRAPSGEVVLACRPVLH